jgi:hypothetical protein
MTEPSEITSALAVIDATLAGEAVEPEYAELAELALILADGGEAPSPEFAAELDRRAARRFASEAGGGATPARRSRRWLFAPGAAVGLAAVIAVVVVLTSGSAPPRHLVEDFASSASNSATKSGHQARPAPAQVPATRAGAATISAFGPDAKATAGSSGPAPTPHVGGRQIVQSAQLSLSTPAGRVDSVAQQVFDVVAAQNGVVENSNVTSTSAYGNAQFSLSVPSADLSRTLNALSRLHGANVVSRSDASQDITGQVGGAGRRLAEARALRTSLLRQLAAAGTATAVNSLRAQIHHVDAAIDRDLSSLRSLQRKVTYSRISVTVNSAAIPVRPPVGRGGGFTLSRAAHDAGRVLVVAAGVALIALAVLVPLGLVVVLGIWLASLLRQRRREQALDLL